MANKSFTNIIGEKQSALKIAWGNIFHVFKRDLVRLIKNPIATFVVLFVLVFPCLYAWIGTNAYWDPYSNTSGLQIAIVNEDEPADTGIAGEINLGSMIEDGLRGMPLLGWDFTNFDDAMNKLDAGDVYSTIVIPKDFSKSFAILINDAQARDYVHFDYFINERENGAAVKIFDIASSTIEGQINQRFIQTVSDVIAQKLHEITGQTLDSASNYAHTVSGKINNVANSVNRLDSLITDGAATTSSVQSTIDSSKSLITDIKLDVASLQNIVNDANSTCSNLRTRVAQAIEDLEKSGIELRIVKEVMLNLESSIDENIASLNKLSELLIKIDSTCNQLNTVISDVNSMMSTTDMLSGNVQTKVKESYNKLKSISEIVDGDMASAPFLLKSVLDSNSKNLGTFISTPVAMDNHIINEVKLYGIGAVPFFSNLTLWIAGLVLIALFRTEVDPPKKRRGFNAHQAYISRGMLFACVAILQGVVCAIGDFAIGVTCENYALFVITCAIASFTFTSIIYMLSACFKHVGKAIAVVLIIMQIPGSSGMFPVAMMPDFYAALSPFLPFTYGIEALREAIVSPNYAIWACDIFILLLFVMASIIIGVYARKHLANLNALFDKKLAFTGLMECDAKDHLVSMEFTSQNFVEILEDSLNDINLRQNLELIREKFQARKRNAAITLWVLPTLLLIIFSVIFVFVQVDINTKIILLMVWLLTIIFCVALVIVLEFKCNGIDSQLNEISNRRTTVAKNKDR